MGTVWAKTQSESQGLWNARVPMSGRAPAADRGGHSRGGSVHELDPVDAPTCGDALMELWHESASRLRGIRSPESGSDRGASPTAGR